MTVAKSVERHSGVALWRQIADRIRVSIADGEFDETGMLPPAFDLAARFGVNRHTVRAAVAFLAEEGLVETVQGHGTTILGRDKLTLPISKRTRFSAGIGGQAGAVHIRVVASGTHPASNDVIRLLELPEGADCVEIEEVGFAGGRAVSCSQHFFPADRFAAMAEHIEATGSITKAFIACGLPDYLRKSTEISARHADARERDLLKLSPGAIVLEARAINVDPDGKPVQCSRTRFSADRISLKLEV
ncbi:phosphonate metabolism transcriptional regulator PhnF [Oryzibacter oryziterrae]|uniref:phosphonate metabolism transcriptional regulator PhnF n=1 Tax=Oryzibacter oryziterrae TaxID=2766474 RepID=UPI001EFF76AA|nr:phosphonate metabolism transcriptional regulator PhnF [Oryzibacter oryziterrae]